MNHTAIKVLLVLGFLFALIPLSSALQFNFTSAPSASLNENISISISATTSDTYDVKIIILDLATKKTISEIYNDGWKNPFYYVISAFPEYAEFTIRASNYSSNAQVCVKMRKTNLSSYSESCRAIALLNQEYEDEEDNSLDKILPRNSSSPFAGNISKDSSNDSDPDFVPLTSNVVKCEATGINTSITEEKIILNPASKEGPVILKEQKIRQMIPYVFLIVCILIIIYLSAKVNN